MPGAFALLLATTVAAVAPPAYSRALLDVVVIVEPDITLSAADLKVIADDVRSIWRPAADVKLRRDGSPSSVVGSETIQLVLTSRVRRVSGPALGWVDFVGGTPQPLITVSVSEIAALMHAGRWQGRALDTLPGAVRQRFTRRALACTIAHELGHYLLRSTAHASHGLMQANFAVDDIMDPATPVVRLRADEIARVTRRAVPLTASADPVTIHN